MSYLILADKNGEFDRRDLLEPMTIGRAMDCNIVVRDILLSRKHCRVEPFNGRWVISDLGSKNGTRIGNEVITRHVLSDGDVIRMGKTQLCFREGPYVPPPKDSPKRRDSRPMDPKEALEGTVSGFQYFDMEEDSRKSGFPIPKPKPADPASYRQEEVHSMVTQISSSSWDLALTEPDAKLQPTPTTPAVVAKRQQEIQQAKTGNGKSVEPPPAQPYQRGRNPNHRGVIPRWLAWTYVMIVFTLICACVGIILARSM